MTNLIKIIIIFSTLAFSQDYGIWEIDFYNEKNNHMDGEAYIKNKKPIIGEFLSRDSNKSFPISVELNIGKDYINIFIINLNTNNPINYFPRETKIGLKHNNKDIFKTNFATVPKYELTAKFENNKIMLNAQFGTLGINSLGFAKKKIKKIFSLLKTGGKFDFSIVNPKPLNKNTHKDGYYFSLQFSDDFKKAYKHLY